MRILVINSGSSSIKYQVLDMATESVLASGVVERIGDGFGNLTNTFYPKTNQERVMRIEQEIADHRSGMLLAVSLLTDPVKGVIKDKKEIEAIGHRVVHGGEDFQKPTIITPAVIEVIKANIPLAPLHNPPNLECISIALELFPNIGQVAVFDTAFHQTMPPHAYMYALPYAYYEENRVRRYGFHGTSHKFVAGEAAKRLGKLLNACNLITVHLGNGCSITAVQKGLSVDTSLGLTPLEGLVMGTRCGDIDPAIHAFLKRNKNMDLDQIDAVLNKESGLKGLCGMNDMRDIHKAITRGDERAELALAVQTYRNRKYIGAYMAVLGYDVDAIVFTAGIGENDGRVRAESLRGMNHSGVELDLAINEQLVKQPLTISTEESSIAVYVIPTNEELAIARETATALDG